MTVKTYTETGKVGRLEINEGIFFTIDMPRKPDEGKISLTLEQIFQPFLGKQIKLTIEEI